MAAKKKTPKSTPKTNPPKRRGRPPKKAPADARTQVEGSSAHSAHLIVGNQSESPAASVPPSPPPVATRSDRAYLAGRGDASAERTRRTQEKGPLPPVQNPERRAKALASLQVYCETYKKATFYWDWSADHLTAIDRLEECVLRGGLFAIAMTRGGGKSALARAAAEWAVLKGVRRFPVLIGATDDLAEDLLMMIKNTFERNDLLSEDFPEVCHPVRMLEGRANKCKGQTIDGERTRMVWSDHEIALPHIPGSVCSGAVILACGITGSIRGLNRPAPDGGVMRPDLVLLDDIQTRESAASPTQTEKRESTVLGDVLELAGPDTQIAAVMPCTAIYPNDLTDRFLDRNRRPEWRGERFKAVYKFPDRKDLWDTYADIRADSMRAGGDGSQATEFYVLNRDEMDRGAVVAWPQRMKPGEVSGLQCAMNVKIDKPDTFAAEWQNEPRAPGDMVELRQLDEKALALKLNNLPRGTVPRECNKVTAFIDVQAEILFYAACGWTDRFGGALVQYGTYPQQPRPLFTAGEPDVKLSQIHKGAERGARIYAGLSVLVPQILGQQYQQDGASGPLSVSLCMIDCGFETDSVHEYISRSQFRALLKPSKGRGVKADQKPMSEYRKAPGDLTGWNWRIDAAHAGKGRFVSFDTYSWKTALCELLLAAPGASRSFYLPGGDLQKDHPLLTTHLLAEYRTPTFGQGRVVEVWKSRPDQRENHWLDCIIGASVAAGVTGLQFSATGEAKKAAPRPTVNAAEEARKRRLEFQKRRGF
jgi:hypothetical protein